MHNRYKSLLNLIPCRLIQWFASVPLLKIHKLNDIKSYFEQRYNRKYGTFHSGNYNHLKVIIFGLRMSVHYNIAVFEKVFSDSFRYHGAIVKNLLCDGFLTSCDASTEGEWDFVHCISCKSHKKCFMDIYRNDFIFLSQFVSKNDVNSIRDVTSSMNSNGLVNCHYLGVNIGKHAIDSCIKYFRYGIFDPKDQFHLKRLRHSVFQAMLTVKVGQNLIALEKPTHLFTLHGCYSTWGPLSEYLSLQGVNVYIYRKSINKVGDFDFTRYGEDTNDILAKDIWEIAKHQPLDINKKKMLRHFLEKKKSGLTLDYQLYSMGKNNSRSEDIEKLLNSNDRSKFVLYAHLLWDRGFNTLGGIFNDDIEWMFETINFFQSHKDSILFVKPHPGERSFFDWTEKGVKEVILDRIGALPENIVILENDYPIKSFDLMDKGCIGLVFNGTTGLEHSYFKKPVLVAANIHYVNAGAALKANTREEYFNLIKNPEPLFKFIEDNYEIIEKYAYHYYFKQQLPIPFFRDDVFLGHCINWSVLKDYKDFIENDSIMTHVTRSILEGRPVVNPD